MFVLCSQPRRTYVPVNELEEVISQRRVAFGTWALRQGAIMRSGSGAHTFGIYRRPSPL